MNRRHDLDWVRVAAFAVLVVYHVGMYYVSWDWHVKSPHASPALEPLMLLSSPWRLALLFVVSGAATAFLLERRPQGLLADRSRRLLLPLAFGMLVIVVPQPYYEVVEKLPGGYTDGYLAFYARYLSFDGSFCRGDDCLILPTWNHLWFIAYLWVYTVVLLLGRRVVPARVRTAAADRIARALSGAGALLWPMLLLVTARLLLVDRFESTHALVDDWYNHAQYFPVFALGFMLARADGFWTALQRHRAAALGIAAASYGCIAWYFYFAGYGEAMPPPDWLRLSQRVIWGINQWATIAAILGYGYRLRHADSAVLRYLVPAVLPVYMLHQTVTIVFAHNLQTAQLSPLLEGPLLVLLTFATCFAAYETIRRTPWLRPLFGLKREQPTRLVPAESRSADVAT